MRTATALNHCQSDASEDSLGRMLTRTDASGTSKFVWDGWNLIAEFDPSGNETRYYLPSCKSRIGSIWSFETSGNVYQVHSDHTASVRLITDGTGATKSHFEYDAFGNQLTSTNDPLGLNYRFVGAMGVRWDSTSGLYSMRKRWYDPQLGRFVSRDPLRGFAAPNLYTYVDNKPTSTTDALGLDGNLSATLQYKADIYENAQRTGLPACVIASALAMELRGQWYQEAKFDVASALKSPEDVSTGIGQIKPSTAAAVDQAFGRPVSSTEQYEVWLQVPSLNIRYLADYLLLQYRKILEKGKRLRPCGDISRWNFGGGRDKLFIPGLWIMTVSAYNSNQTDPAAFVWQPYDTQIYNTLETACNWYGMGTK